MRNKRVLMEYKGRPVFFINNVGPFEFQAGPADFHIRVCVADCCRHHSSGRFLPVGDFLRKHTHTQREAVFRPFMLKGRVV